MTGSARLAVRSEPDLMDAVLSDPDFTAIADFLRGEAGIVLTTEKKEFVRSRLTKRLRTTGITNFREYLKLALSGEGKRERSEMLYALTTNVTQFFREPYHFDLLVEKVLPDMKRRIARGERVSLWSAGCSEGPEPYSIAMAILRADPDMASANFRILATDIDQNVLRRAMTGRYLDSQLNGVSGADRDRFFTSSDEGWTVNRDVRDLIAFRPLNLIAPWSFKRPFDGIFCRNVVIYFDPPTKEDLWNKFAQSLVPDGWLFVGHSERVSGPARAQLTNHNLTAYQRCLPGQDRSSEY